jgi:hypothetical protein
MHDPMTVAFKIPRPWPARERLGPAGKKVPFRYWPPWITVWHVDPEADGSDDSCGWSFPRPLPGDAEWAKKKAIFMWRERFGYSAGGLLAASNRDVLTSLWCEVRTQYTRPRKGYIWRPLPKRDSDAILRLCISSVDNFHDAIVEARTGAKGMERLLRLIIRIQRQLYRPWYRHPRWHVRHWQIQVHPVQQLKRFLFSRCAVCGKGFRYGESPCSGWNGSGGPRWFRGEPQIWHSTCNPGTNKAPAPDTLH